MRNVSVVGIDLAKNVFHLVGRDQRGREVFRRKLSRKALLRFMVQLPSCRIGMEACSGAHYWAREFEALGHEARLISPQFVKPYVKTNKNDLADAEAICEALSRPHMRFVPVKKREQQDVLALHTVRARLVRHRTAVVNEARSMAYEYGVVIPKGITFFRRLFMHRIEVAAPQITPILRELLLEVWEEIKALDQRVGHLTRRIEQMAKSNELCQRIQTIPGVGVLTASAVVATIGNGNDFKNGRHLAAWLGLVPRQHSTGDKPRLLGISKRGDAYLRRLLTQGSHAVARHSQHKQDRRSRWWLALQQRRGTNKACIALANKNARVIWAVLQSGEAYQSAA